MGRIQRVEHIGSAPPRECSGTLMRENTRDTLGVAMYGGITTAACLESPCEVRSFVPSRLIDG